MTAATFSNNLYGENANLTRETCHAFYQDIFESMQSLVTPLSDSAAIRLHITMSADELKQKYPQLIELAKKFVDGLVSLPKEDLTFESAVQPFAMMEGIFQTVSSCFNFPHYVSTDAAVRDASVEATKALEDFRVDLYMRKDLFVAFKTVQETEKAQFLKGEDRRILEKSLLDFKRNGLYLSEEKYERMKELKKKLSKLSVEFSQAVNEDTTFVLFTAEDLEGCSEVFFKSLEKVTEDGIEKYKVTMKYPDLFGVLQYAKREATRQKIDYINSTRCQSNGPLLFEACQIRHEIAQLLGYPDHASYVVEEKMVKKPEVVVDVIL